MIFSRNPNLHTNAYTLSMNNSCVERVYEYKYLGLHLQSDLKWNNHIMHISKKISNFMGPLYKCSHILPQSTRIKLYYAYVYPHLLWLNPIWYNYSKSSHYLFKHLQIIQNKFVRTIFREIYYNKNNIDTNGNKIMETDALYKKYNILTLKQININESAQMTHKILNGNINIDIKFIKNSDIHEHNTRARHQLHISKIKTNIKRDSFLYKASIIYNNLPTDIKSHKEFPVFKKKLKNYVLNSGVT